MYRVLIVFCLFVGTFGTMASLEQGSPPISKEVFLKAVESGDSYIVHKWIVGGHNPNVRDEHGCPALKLAVVKRHHYIRDMLLDAGATVDAQTRWTGDTALMWAAWIGDDDSVEVLVEAGASVNIHSRSGSTALIWAARQNHTEIVKTLIAAGALIDAQGSLDRNALMWASSHGNSEMVNALLAENPDTELQDDLDRTALRLAMYEEHDEVADILVVAGAIPNRDYYSWKRCRRPWHGLHPSCWW